MLLVLSSYFTSIPDRRTGAGENNTQPSLVNPGHGQNMIRVKKYFEGLLITNICAENFCYCQGGTSDWVRSQGGKILTVRAKRVLYILV
jgi:hypothetical protein